MFTSLRVCIPQIKNAILKNLVHRFEIKERNIINLLKLIPNLPNSNFLISDPKINLIDKSDKIKDADYDSCLFQVIEKYEAYRFSFKYEENNEEKIAASIQTQKQEALALFRNPDMSVEWLKCKVWKRENYYLAEFNNFGGIFLKNIDEVFILE
jgi:hypothetical protein